MENTEKQGFNLLQIIGHNETLYHKVDEWFFEKDDIKVLTTALASLYVCDDNFQNYVFLRIFMC